MVNDLCLMMGKWGPHVSSRVSIKLMQLKYPESGSGSGFPIRIIFPFAPKIFKSSPSLPGIGDISREVKLAES